MLVCEGWGTGGWGWLRRTRNGNRKSNGKGRGQELAAPFGGPANLSFLIGLEYVRLITYAWFDCAL
jgi:hypothetical protein